MTLAPKDIAAINNSLLFDPDWYSQTYPDVVELGMNPAEHYLRMGARMGRAPSADFDTPAYLAANPDVAKQGLNPLLHHLMSATSDDTETAPNNDVPHYGPALHDLVQSAVARTRAPGADEVYEAIRAGFDITYYLLRYRDLRRAKKLDLIQHYINAGAREGRDPSPHFCTAKYLARYPDVRKAEINPFYHWLTVGKALGYIAEPFNGFDEICDLLEGRQAQHQALLIQKRTSLRNRLEHGALGDMVAKASALEPLIAHSWGEAITNPKFPPFHSSDTMQNVAAIHALQAAAGFERARMLIVVNRPRWGGGRRLEGHIVHALSQRLDPSQVVIINTDESGELPPGRFPDGCRLVDFAAITKQLKPVARQRLLAQFMRTLRPAAVLNINSRLFWDIMPGYGTSLSQSFAMYAGLFCNEQTELGFWTGYPARQVYRHFDTLSGVVTDSHDLRDSLIEQFVIPPEQQSKLTVLEAPVDPSIAVAAVPDAARPRPQIFWSGRFDRQKRVDILFALARRMPDVDFRMWGEPVLEGAVRLEEKPGNISFEGVYGAFSELPLHDADLWLYTSEWDGVPSILLEVSMTGLPIVGSLVGGTGEIIREDLGRPIADFNDVDAYETALRDVLARPELYRERAQTLRTALQHERTEAAYLATLEGLLPPEVLT